MTNQTSIFPALPLDASAWWDASGKPLDYAAEAVKAWLDAAGSMQREALEFVSSRFAEDTAAIAKLGQCRTPLEVASVQAEYAGRAFADFVNEGQKMAACLNAAQDVLLRGPRREAAAKGKASPSPGRSPHRASTH